MLVFATLAVFLIFSTYYGTKTLSSVRAYIAAEGLWTKAQKEATQQLLQYSMYENETYFHEFQQTLQLQYRFSRARKTMVSDNPSHEVAQKGFQASELQPDDIALMIWLGSNFSDISYLHQAFTIWQRGDQQIAKLDSLGSVFHQKIESNQLTLEERNRLIRDIRDIDHQLTELENSFSATLTEAAHWVNDVIFWMILGSGILLIGVGYVITAGYFRKISDLNRELAHLSLVAEKTADLVITTDAEGRVIWVNKTFEQTTGYTLEEMKGKIPGEVLQGPDTDPDTVKRFARAVSQKDTIRQRILNYTKEGEKIWLDVTLDPIFNNQGECTHFVAIERDVTHQVEQQTEVKKSLERYNIVARATSDTIWDLDLKNNMINYNDVIHEMFGYSKKQVEHTLNWWEEKIHPDDEKKVYRKLGQALETGQDRFQLEYRFRCADNTYKHIYDRAFVVTDEDGMPVRIIGAMQDITERKEARKQQEQSRKLLESVTENADTPIWVRDGDGKHILANKEWKKLFGLENQEVIGKTLDELLPASTAKEFHKNDLRTISSDESRTFYEQVCVNGENRYFATSMFPLNDVPGLERAAGGVAIDITARRQAEEALKSSQQRMSTLFSNLPGMAYRCKNERNWPMIFLSEGCRDVTGYKADTLTGNDQDSGILYGDIIHKDDKEYVWNSVQNAIENQDPYQMTYRIYHKDGEIRWVWERGIVAQYHSGEELYLEGFISDITARKHAEEKLKETEKKMREIIEHSTNMFYRHTPDHVLTYVSPQSQEFLGCNPEEAKTRWTEFVTDNPVNEEGLKHTERAIKTGNTQPSFELELEKQTGEIIWVEVNEAPIVEDGKTVAIVGSLTDITERKEAEEEISEALKEKETLLAEVHHRVKNNMAVVSGIMQLQAFQEDDPELKAKLFDNVARIGTMASIHENLYQSKTFATLRFSENLEKIIKKLIKTMQSGADITVKTELEPIQLNLNQAVPCSLIVSEVITNALKHAFRGREQGRLRVALSENKNQVKLLIKDNGVGLPEDVNPSESDQSLGLHLITKLSKQLHAEFDYESTEEGTQFQLQFEKTDVKGSSAGHSRVK